MVDFTIEPTDQEIRDEIHRENVVIRGYARHYDDNEIVPLTEEIDLEEDAA